MLSIIQANEGDEFLAYFPEWKLLYTDQLKKYQALCTQIQTDFEKKDQNSMYASFFPQLNQGATVRKILSNSDIKYLESVIPAPSDELLPKSTKPKRTKEVKEDTDLEQNLLTFSKTLSKNFGNPKLSAMERDAMFTTLQNFVPDMSTGSTPKRPEINSCFSKILDEFNSNVGIFSRKQKQLIKQFQNDFKNIEKNQKVGNQKLKNLNLLNQNIIIHLGSLIPHQEKIQKMNKFIENLIISFKKKWSTVEILPFGSFAAGLISDSSDIDLSLVFPQEPSSSPKKISSCLNPEEQEGDDQDQEPDDETTELVPQIMEFLETLKMLNIDEVVTARTPIIKFQSPDKSFHIDLSFKNHLGVLKAQFFRYFVGYDDRFHSLVLIVKNWARKRNINDPTNYTLNSFVFTMMVLFYLQRTTPPVCPVLEVGGTQEGMKTSQPLHSLSLLDPLDLHAALFAYPKQVLPPLPPWCLTHVSLD